MLKKNRQEMPKNIYYSFNWFYLDDIAKLIKTITY